MNFEKFQSQTRTTEASKNEQVDQLPAFKDLVFVKTKFRAKRSLVGSWPCYVIQLFGTKTDKKKFTALGLSKLLANTNANKNYIHRLELGENSRVNQQVFVASVIQPDLLVIHFSNLLSSTDPCWENLLSELYLEWNKNPGFDMVDNFPDEGVYVVAALEVPSDHEDAHIIINMKEAANNRLYQNEGESLCSSELGVDDLPQGNQMSSVDDLRRRIGSTSLNNHASRVPFTAKIIVYYRGFITKLNPGKDPYSAEYDVFLYDKGIHKKLGLDQMIPLSEKFRTVKTVPPQYALLKFPGLKPLKSITRCVELWARKMVHVLVPCEDWPTTTVELVKQILSSKTLNLEVLGTHGIYVFANLLYPDTVDNKDGIVNYVKYLVWKDLAEEDDKSYFADMLKDAEDEELIEDWTVLARTCY